MPKNTRFLFFLFFVLLAGRLFAANCQYSAISQSGLSKEQTAAVKALFSGDFKVKIYSKEIEGIKKHVFVVGEKHVKDEVSARVMAAIHRHFTAFALESSDPKNYIPFFFHINTEKLYFREKGEKYNSSVDFIGIGDAIRSAVDGGEVTKKDLVEDAKEYIDDLAEHYSQPVDLVKELYYKTLESIDATKPKASKTESFYIEDHYSPSLKERLYFAGFHLAAHFSNYRGLGSLFVIHVFTRLMMEAPVLYPGLHVHEYLSLLVIPVSMLTVEKLFKGFAASPNRDRFMVSGVDASLEKSQADHLIYIVGLDHLKPQDSMLIERGFQAEEKLLNEIKSFQ